MPSPDDIRSSVATIANDWRSLAFGWHIALGIAMVCVVAGWRPSLRLGAAAIATPLVSVSVLAWLAGNPFNGLMFGFVSLALLTIAIRLPGDHQVALSSKDSLFGFGFVAFGWTYPHFLVAQSPINYLYESPFGLIPCPTLSVVAGVSIIASAFDSQPWRAVVATVSIVYGVIGVLLLSVTIDLVLIAAAVVLVWPGLTPARSRWEYFHLRAKIPRKIAPTAQNQR